MTNDVSIQPATIDDIDGLTASSNSLFAEDAAVWDKLRDPGWPAARAKDLPADIADPDRLVLVAKSGGLVSGHLLAGFRAASKMWLAPQAVLITLYVGPAVRGRGVGSRLVEHFVSWAQERGASQLRVSAFTGNESAIRFYRRHGFAPLETTFVRNASAGRSSLER